MVRHIQNSFDFYSLSFVSSPLAEDGPAVDATSLECLDDAGSSSLLRFLGGGPGARYVFWRGGGEYYIKGWACASNSVFSF